MKEIKLEQGSQEWLDFRKSRIMASDIPIILGVSKWSTPYVLWQEKLGFKEGQKENFAMRRGSELEPFVRDLYNDKHETKFVPMVICHDELEFFGASLDGIYKDEVLEIKCTSLENHRLAEEGKIPDVYYPQVQWQLFVAGLEKGVYVSYFDREIAEVKYTIDLDYVTNTLIPKAKEFLTYLTDYIEPPKSDKDYIQITDPEFEKYAREYKASKEMLDLYDEKVKYYKNKLISLTDDSNCKGYGLSLKRVESTRVDNAKRLKDIFKDFPELETTYSDEKYKSESIGYWKITIDSK